MIIIKLMGGLGNQLQQYALYQKFISLGKEAYLDTSWFAPQKQVDMLAPRKLELNLFEDADYQIANENQIQKLCGNNQGLGGQLGKIARKLHIVADRHFYEKEMYHPEIFDMEDVYLEGYWAAEKYYADILEVLQDKLCFSNINNENQKMTELISKNSTPYRNSKAPNTTENATQQYSCAVHIRRGDYLDPINAEMFGGIATEAYYDSAMEYVKTRHPNTTYFIFSDDQEYVRARYGNDTNCVFVDINHGDNSRYDIYLMSLCDGHICANSTFSFWGARLDSRRGKNANIVADTNDTILIRPYIHKNSQRFISEEMHDLWENWVLIDSEGKER